MPLLSKKKGEKPKMKGDASDVTTDDVRRPLSMGVRKVRHTGSELSSTEMKEETKRFKPGSPMAKRAAALAAAAAVPAAVVVVDGAERAAAGAAAAEIGTADASAMSVGNSDAVSVSGTKTKRARKKAVSAPEPGIVGQVKAVAASLLEVVFREGVPAALAKSVLEHSGRFGEILFGLMAENARLRGRLDIYEAKGVVGGVSVAPRTVMGPPAAGPVRRSAPVRVPAVPVAGPKPVETWSVVVKGKSGVTSQEVVEKVVGPTMDVRVHELRPLRSGGAIIRTPSVAEREKLAANAKFREGQARSESGRAARPSGNNSA